MNFHKNPSTSATSFNTLRSVEKKLSNIESKLDFHMINQAHVNNNHEQISSDLKHALSDLKKLFDGITQIYSSVKLIESRVENIESNLFSGNQCSETTELQSVVPTTFESESINDADLVDVEHNQQSNISQNVTSPVSVIESADLEEVFVQNGIGNNLQHFNRPVTPRPGPSTDFTYNVPATVSFAEAEARKCSSQAEKRKSKPKNFSGEHVFSAPAVSHAVWGKSKKGFWKCICGFKNATTNKRSAIAYHVRRMMFREVWKCTKTSCNEVFNEVWMVRKHLRENHGGHGTPKLYGCPVCLRLFDNITERGTHLNEDGVFCYKAKTAVIKPPATATPRTPSHGHNA